MKLPVAATVLALAIGVASQAANDDAKQPTKKKFPLEQFSIKKKKGSIGKNTLPVQNPIQKKKGSKSDEIEELASGGVASLTAQKMDLKKADKKKFPLSFDQVPIKKKKGSTDKDVLSLQNPIQKKKFSKSDEIEEHKSGGIASPTGPRDNDFVKFNKKEFPSIQVPKDGIEGDQIDGQAATESATSYIVIMKGLPVKPSHQPGGDGIEADAAQGLLMSHNGAIREAGVPFERKIHDYVYALNGFSAILTSDEVKALENQDDVLRVVRDEWRYPTTDSTPTFLGLTEEGGAWMQGYDGTGVVVGVVDSGIWPEHPSFADDGSYPEAEPLDETKHSSCEFGNVDHNPSDLPFECNNKLIGARSFLDTYRELEGIPFFEFDSARDYDGHGTHTASTVAGNAGVESAIFGVPRGAISGIAHRAQIIAYKACVIGCTESDLAAAIDQAVADGVDVINYSIGGGAGAPGEDDLAFLNAANAGVFAATSAGNSGPGPATVGSPAHMPWLMSVGASTESQFFGGAVTLGDGSKYVGASITTPPIVEALLVDAEFASLDGSDLCFKGTLDPQKVKFKIVLCRRGVIDRVEKSFAVWQAGGIGTILYNIDDAGSLSADLHYTPTVHIDFSPGKAIKEYIAQNPGTATAIISEEKCANTDDDAPFMAGFSSRGPNPVAAAINIIKPDITAPGVATFAAVSPTDPNQGQMFAIYSGTSMSSPHIAGVGAILKQAHPDWTPAMIKSAIMTTADQDVLDSDRKSLAGPFDMGAGHVNIAPREWKRSHTPSDACEDTDMTTSAKTSKSSKSSKKEGDSIETETTTKTSKKSKKQEDSAGIVDTETTKKSKQSEDSSKSSKKSKKRQIRRRNLIESESEYDAMPDGKHSKKSKSSKSSKKSSGEGSVPDTDIDTLPILDPGLVYDTSYVEYLGFLCDAFPNSIDGTTPDECAFYESVGIPVESQNLNLPSIGAGQVAGVQTVIRTVTCVVDSVEPVIFHASMDAPRGFEVSVVPSTLMLMQGETATFEVTITRTSAPLGEWSFGSLTWGDYTGRYEVRSPLAVNSVEFDAPSKIELDPQSFAAVFDVAFGYTGDYTAAPHGMVADTPTTSAVNHRGYVRFQYNIQSAEYVRWELVIPGDDDLDLLLYDSLGNLIAVSGNEGTDESIELTLPADDTYTIQVNGYFVLNEFLVFTLSYWEFPLSSGGGSLSIESAPSSATLGGTGTIEISSTSLSSEVSYLGAVSHTGDNNELLASTLVSLTNPSPINAPSRIRGTGEDGSENFEVEFGFTGTYTAAPHGMVADDPTPGSIGQDPDQEYPSPDDPDQNFPSPDDGVVKISYDIQSAAYVRWELVIPGVDDLDLFLEDSTGTIIAASLNGGTNELIVQPLPADDTYTLVVHGWFVPNEPLSFTISYWEVPLSSGGSLSIDSAPSLSVNIGDTATVQISWTVDDGEGKYLGAVSHTGNDDLLALTLVEVEVPPLVKDPSFEDGIPNSFWTESSTNFGTPLCSISSCGGAGGGTGPRTGVWWAWFGGTQNHPEIGRVSQTILLPQIDVVTLTFWLEVPRCSDDTSDYLQVKIDVLDDGNDADIVYEEDATSNLCGQVGYQQVTVDLSTYSGKSILLEFYSELSSGVSSSFFVDDVQIDPS